MELIKKVSNKRKLFVFAFSFFFLCLIISCSEEPLKVGIHLLPEDEFLEVYDTVLPVELYTISAEPLNSGSLTYSPLGSVMDPLMGALKADYLADIFHNGDISFQDTIDPDNRFVYSLDLVLYYDYLYGDSLAIDFSVYELIEPIPTDKKSDFVVTPDIMNPNPINIGKPEFLNDSTRAFKLALKLNYANKFIRHQMVVEDSAYYLNNVGIFKEYFKGIYIATEFRNDEGGGIVRVTNNSSRLVLKTLVWNKDSVRFDTITDQFSVGNTNSPYDTIGVNLSMYHEILADDISAVLNDTINSQPLVYTQALAGPFAQIYFPTLDNFREKFNYNVIINKAELILPINQDFFDNVTYTSPVYMGLFDNASKTYLLDDGLISYYFGGILDEENYQYKFNIGNHIHEYMRGGSDTLFSKKYILFPSEATSPVEYLKTLPGRVVLNGGSSNDAPSLRILYSTIPE